MTPETDRPPIVDAEIIAVGSELLTPWRLDTNSLFITERLNEIGIEIRAKTIVGDSRHDLLAIFTGALARTRLVILTGGLGPTDDDVTREVVAAALGRTLTEQPEITARIQRRFERRGWTMPDINRRQAMVPEGAVVIENPRGTAPGLWIEHDHRIVLLLPGPPRELQPMLDGLIRGPLAERASPGSVFRRLLRVAGRSESHVDAAAQPIYTRWQSLPTPIATTILAVPGQIELHLSVRALDGATAARILDDAVAELVVALAPDVYSTDGRTMEQVVGDLLRARGHRVAIAESCTGGLVAARLTEVPGSSDYLDAGVVSYSNRAKVEWLGVPDWLIAQHGAVSAPVAEAMADGARSRANTEWAIGVTGIAGPTGGTETKPVGMVVIAVAGPDTRLIRTYQFPGDRPHIRAQAVHAGLDMLRRALLA